MANVGSVELELRLNRVAFDKDLASLSKLEIPPINLDVKLNNKSLNKQLKDFKNGDYGCIPIEICPDIKGLKRKLKEISKLRIDCIPVEICPDLKGFEAKLTKLASSSKKYSFKIDTDALSFSVERGINRGIANSRKKLDIDVHPKTIGGNNKKALEGISNDSFAPIKLVSAQLLQTFDKLSDELVDALKRTVKSVTNNNPLKGLATIFTKTISSIVSVILLPLTVLSSSIGSIFGGIGLQIGSSLSDSLVKGAVGAIEGSIGKSIGSFSLLGEVLGKDLLDSIRNLGGGKNAIAKAFSELLPIEEILGEIVASGAGSKSVAIESLAKKNAQRAANKAKAQAAKEEALTQYEAVRPRQARAVEVSKAFEKQRDVTNTFSTVFAGDFAKRQKEVAAQSEKINVKLTPESLSKIRQKEYDKQVSQYTKIAEELQKKGATRDAAKVRQLIAALRAPSASESISDKEVAIAEQQRTISARSKFSSRILNKEFAPRKAELQKEQARLRALSRAYQTEALPVLNAFQSIETLGLQSSSTSRRIGSVPSSDANESFRSNQRERIAPTNYEQIVQQVASLSGTTVSKKQIPHLQASDKLPKGANAAYLQDGNTILVSQAFLKQVQQGKLTDKNLETLIHELRHAVQSGFGGSAPIVPDNQLLRPTSSEVSILGKGIESSTAIHSIDQQDSVRSTEADAYVFARRNLATVKEQQAKNQALASINKVSGIGGSKVVEFVGGKQLAALKKVQEISALGQGKGLDTSALRQQALASIDNVQKKLEKFLGKLGQVEDLSATEINALETEVLTYLETTVTSINSIPTKAIETLKKQLNNEASAKSDGGKLPTPVLRDKEVDEAVSAKVTDTKENLSRLTVKDLRSIALKASVSTYNKETKKPRTKAELIDGLGKVSPTVLDPLIPALGRPDAEQVTRSKALAKTDKAGVVTQSKAFNAKIASSISRLAPLSQRQSALDEVVREQIAVENAIALSSDIGVKRALKGQSLYLSRLKLRIKGAISEVKLKSRSAIQTPDAVAARELDDVQASFGDFRDELENIIRALSAQNPIPIPERGNGKKSEEIALRRIRRKLERQPLPTPINPARTLDDVNSDIEEYVPSDSITPTPFRTDRRTRQPSLTNNFFRPSKDRVKNSQLTKSRYLVENAPGLAALVNIKAGPNVTVQQVRDVQKLQAAFLKLGEAAEKYGSNKSTRNFNNLNSATKEVEQSLNRLGVPLSRVNSLIDEQREAISRLTGSRVDLTDAIAQPFNEAEESIGRAAGATSGLGNILQNVGKAAIAFFGFGVIKNALSSLASGSLTAAVSLEQLKTALVFSSGGIKQGADNLAFVNSVVSDLRIPLKSAQEGFASLAGATRGSSLQGTATKDVFLGMSQAATVLGLSSDQTSRALLALSQIASKGTVSAEELRGQLAESGLSGTMGIAARAIGVTESQLNKLLETGQVLASDFLPKFGQQLQTEFGGAAIYASEDLQSSLFNLENTILTLKQNIGTTFSPLVQVGANAISSALEFLNKNATATFALFTAISVIIAAPLLGPMLAVIKALPIMSALILGVKSAINALLASAGKLILVFIAIEAALIAYETIVFFKDGGTLQKQFQGLTDAADNALEKILNLKKEINKPIERPVANPLDYPINFINDRHREEIINLPDKLLRKDKTRAQILKEFDERGGAFPSFAFTDAKKAADVIREQLKKTALAGSGINKLSQSALFGQGEIGLLPSVDDQIQKIADQRKILEGRVTREFTNKGLNIPLSIRTEQQGLNEAFNKATGKRADLTKPYTEDLATFQQLLEQVKAAKQQLDDPETAAKFGGQAEVDALKKSIAAVIPIAEKARDTLGSLLRSSKADPVVAFTDAFKLLNKQLSITSETTANRSLQAQLDLSKSSLNAFSKDVDASLKSAILDATIEKTRLKSELDALSKDFTAKSKELDSARFKPTLDRFNLKSTSSVATVQAAIDAPNTTEADKTLLEQIKSVAEAGVKVKEARKALSDSELKEKKVAEDTALALIQKRYSIDVAVSKIAENQKTVAVKNELNRRNITVEESSVKLSAIALSSTKAEISRSNNQLAQTRLLYSKGILSVEKFTEQERTLLVTQSELKKQLADDEVNNREASNAKILADFEELNAKIAATIASQSTQRQNALKKLQLSRGADSEGIKVTGDRNLISDAEGRIKVAKEELSNNQKLEDGKVITAKTALVNRRRINQELLTANGELLNAQLTQEETFRTQVEASYNRRFSTLELLTSKAQTSLESSAFDVIRNADSPIDLKANEFKSADSGIALRKNAITENNKIISEQLKQLPSLFVGKDLEDKQTDLYKKLATNAKEYLQVEKDEFASVQNQAIDSIEQRTEAQKRSSDKVISSLEAEKEAYNLISSSIDRSKQLLESRASVQSAISNAAVIGAEIALESAPDTSKQQLSVNLANLKLSVLKQEQVTATELLALDLKRQKLSAQMAISEAEIAQSRAMISRIEIAGELAIALEREDARAIASAQAKLDLQNLIVSATGKQLENSRATLDIQDELAGNAQRALSINQQAAVAQGNAAVAAAARLKDDSVSSNAALNSSNSPVTSNIASDKKPKKVSLFEQSRLNHFAPAPTNKNVGLPPEYFNLKAVTQKVPTTSTGSGTSGISAENELNAALGIRPGESTEDLLKRQLGLDPKLSAEAYDRLPKQLFFGQDRTGTFEALNKKYAPKTDSLQQLQQMYKPKANSLGQLQEMYKTDANSFEELNQKYAPKENTSAQFTESLKMANKGIEERLDKLNASLAAATNSPRNLYVSSPEPVSDAVKIMADINRMNIQSSGLG